MGKPVLVIDYSVDGESGANISRWFTVPVVQARVEPEGLFPNVNPGDFRAVVHSGSALSITEDSPFTPGARDFVGLCVAKGVPQMGICYGHQLLAKSLVGSHAVGRCSSIEIGWLKVEFLETWPVRGLLGEKAVWQSHYDYVKELPPGSVITSTNSHTKVQSFVNYDLKLFGTQFHPEFDRDSGNRCFSSDPEIFIKNGISMEETLRGRPDFQTGEVIFSHFLKTFEQEM